MSKNRLSGLEWAKQNLVPMPLLERDKNMDVFLYEWEHGEYKKKSRILRNARYTQLIRLRIEVLDKYNKEHKNGV